MTSPYPSETIRVCAWCYPGRSVFELFPEWAGLGLQISHGICREHKERMERDMKALNTATTELKKAA